MMSVLCEFEFQFEFDVSGFSSQLSLINMNIKSGKKYTSYKYLRYFIYGSKYFNAVEFGWK